MPIYASNPVARPDSDFEPGVLRHLVTGARGRLLDPRRTPVSVVEVQVEIGFVLIRIEGFEDEGATWQIPLEQIGHYQFERGSPAASESAVAEMKRAIAGFTHAQEITANDHDRARTDARIDERCEEARAWLSEHSRFLAEGRSLPYPSTRRGDPVLAADLEHYLGDRGLWEIEREFTQAFVSNPGAGEIVKGHCIVLAELGLAGYSGPIVRDPATFTEAWTRERRAEHITSRLAFVRALFDALGRTRETLWRGMSTATRRDPGLRRTFVSTTFDEAVARSHYEGGGPDSTHFLAVREVPVERLLMTYLETAAMNTIFLEAEAVVFDHRDDCWP